MSPRQQKPEEMESPDAHGAPQTYKVQPQKIPDWSTLQAEVTAQFTQTLVYLAK